MGAGDSGEVGYRGVGDGVAEFCGAGEDLGVDKGAGRAELDPVDYPALLMPERPIDGAAAGAAARRGAIGRFIPRRVRVTGFPLCDFLH